MHVAVFRYRVNTAFQEEFGRLYAEMAIHIKSVAGYKGHKVFAAEDGEFVVIADFENFDAVEIWDHHPEHRRAKERGKTDIFTEYDVVVAEIVEHHSKNQPEKWPAAVPACRKATIEMHGPQIGFGGSCHWCTEAIFQALRGVHSVQQGYISALPPDDRFSEAVLLQFDPSEIGLATLIEVHLRTHSCTSAHALRDKYRSAVYVFDDEQALRARQAIANLQGGFDDPILTRVLSFREFEASPEKYRNYYRSDPGRPFCRNNIDPKLKIIRDRFSIHAVAG